jgi:hypothetical protein
MSRAKAQNYEAYKGSSPMSHPGESREHINIHVQFAKEIEQRVEVIKGDIQTIIRNSMEVPSDYKAEFDALIAALGIISEHIMEDSQPVYSEPMQVASRGMQMASGGSQAMGQQGMGQMVSPSGLGGNPMMPNMNAQGTNPIQQAGMQGGPGQLGGNIGMQ